eukprot:825790_1
MVKYLKKCVPEQAWKSFQNKERKKEYEEWIIQRNTNLITAAPPAEEEAPPAENKHKGYCSRDCKGNKWNPYKLHYCAFIDPTPSNSSCSSISTQLSQHHLPMIKENEYLEFKQSMRELMMSAKRGQRNQNWETRTIVSSLSSLPQTKGAIELDDLNRQLKILAETKGLSMNKIRAIMRKKAICLRNGKQYKNTHALRAALRNNYRLIVSAKKAKKYKYVKFCLVNINS